MSTIDDPIEATLSQYQKTEQVLPEKIAGTILEIFGELPPIKIFNIVRSRMLGDPGKERIEAFLNVLLQEIKRLRENHEDQQRQTELLREKFDSPEFIESVVVAVDEVQRTRSESKVRRFVTALSNSLFSKEEDVIAGDDLAAYMRDLSSLSESDVQALDFLFGIYKDTIVQRPNMDDPNDFTFLMGSYTRGLEVQSIDPDDFFGRCLRLTGFGLAAEVRRNDFRMSLKDHCFRPTKRGLRLLKLLEREQQ